jgi:hypothetical protein
MILGGMTISSATPMLLLDRVLEAQTTRGAIDVALLKKAQDMIKEQGESLLHLLERTGACQLSQMLDVYA